MMSSVRVTLRLHRLDDLAWVVQRHGELYTNELGWDHRFEELVSSIVEEFVADFDPDRERCWIAECGDRRVGCVFLVKSPDPGVAKLRMLLVEPEARGSGLGARLIKECIDFAKSSGYQQLVLWTSDTLVSARRLYEHFGFTLIKEEPHAMFGPPMMGQTWGLTL